VASRIANTLRAGYPVRSADELGEVHGLLFHSPPDHMEILLGLLEKAEIDWAGKALVFCDCFAGREVRERLAAKGASIAMARRSGTPGRIITEANDATASHAVRRIARELRIKAVEILPGSADLFDAAMILGSAAITPLIDRAAALLRDAGIRDIEAARIASSVFEQTARNYAHSGKQSWAWHVRKPPVDRLEAQIASAGPRVELMLRQLLSFGFETFRKHGEVAAVLVPGPTEPA
jgi:hypothetical protein